VKGKRFQKVDADINGFCIVDLKIGVKLGQIVY
jgi:hypothetical protein